MTWAPPVEGWVEAQLRIIGVSAAEFCRCLRLPQGINLRTDPSSVTLLQMVALYPWLLPVADADFDPKAVEAYLTEAAEEAAEDLARPTAWMRVLGDEDEG